VYGWGTRVPASQLHPLERVKALLILNPAAGKRTATDGDLERAVAVLTAAGFMFDRVETTPERSSADLARRAIGDGYEACIVAGGDGTVAPAAAALIGSKVVLGILPFGSVMNIAHGLGFPLEPVDAAERIATQRVHAIDAGELNGEVFFEIAGVGLDAELFGAARHAERGSWSDALDRLRRWATHGTHVVTVTVDGGEHRHRVMQLLVFNGPYYGWSLRLAPAARMDDGKLDVAVFPRLGRLALIRALFLLWRARRLPVVPVRYTGREIRIEADEPLSVHADGRLVGTLPVTITCRPAALRVFL
jgi:diacylglycerol kinase (ATP)